MRKKAWFFKNRTVLGILGVMLVFGMLAAGCPNGDNEPPPPTTYVVTFNTDGGSAVENQTVEEGKTVTKPANPTKTGNTFANWYRNAEKTVLWNFDTDVVVQDTTIYAKWVAGENVDSFKITFDADGGAPAPAEQTVLKGEPVQEPVKPTKAGYIFDGWYTGTGDTETRWVFSTDKVTAAIALKAKWIQAVTVTFNTNGGSAILVATVAKGSHVYPNEYQTTRSGHVFDGWYKDDEFEEAAGSSLIVNTEITLYAKWTSTSELASYAGVWRSSGGNEAYWLQADGTVWSFYSEGSFYKGTWSTSQINGSPVTFNDAKTQFTMTYGGGGGSPYTKNTTETKTPTAATGALLGLWVSGSGSDSRKVELKADKTAVLANFYGNSITLNYCADSSIVHLLTPIGNLVILSITVTESKLNGFSKSASDTTLAGIWKLTEGGQDYYWDLKVDRSGTFHTLGASAPFSFTVTEDKKIDGYSYTVTGDTLTISTEWGDDNLAFTKVASIPSGSGAGGDPRLHGTWNMTQGGMTFTITFNSNGVAVQSQGNRSESAIWKADGLNLYFYTSGFSSSRGDYSLAYTVSGSTLTLTQGEGYETVLTKQ